MHTSKASHNFLLCINSNETTKDLFRIAVQFAKNGQKVYFIAANAPESLPIEDYEETVYRDILKNMVFSYSSNASELIAYFMGMSQLRPKPDVILVDFLHTFFDYIDSLDTNETLHASFIDSHMLIAAAICGAVDMLSCGMSTKFISIVCIDSSRHYAYKRFIQTFVDLYYYKKDTIFKSISEIMQHLSQLNTSNCQLRK